MVKAGKRINQGIKIILSLCVILFVIKAFFLYGMKPYSRYKDYSYQNNFSAESVSCLENVKNISQSFTAKGSILNNVSLYLADNPNQTIRIAISDKNGKELAARDFVLSNYHANEWNKFSLSTGELRRNGQYSLEISSEDNLSALVLSSGEAPVIFTGCNNHTDGNLAASFQFTYSYLTLGSAFEFMVRLAFILLMTLALCYAICNFEQIYDSFLRARTGRGLLYAVYFSVSFALLYNPLAPLRNEVSKFNRVIGYSLAVNSDISKRIGNFRVWFVLFAIALVLFYLLFNHFLSVREAGAEESKAILFMDNFIVVADCNLFLRCITYFSDTSSPAVYYFSSYAIMLVMTALLAYIVLKLEKNISFDGFSRLLLTAASVSCPIAVCISLEWEDGRVVLGVMAVCLAAVLVFCRCAGKLVKSDWYTSVSTGGVLVCSILPVMTSAFIELIHVLNQYAVFVAHPARYYKLAVLVMPGAGIALYCFLRRKAPMVRNWKKWSCPVFVFGMACLSVQIPIQSSYGVDIFESANYSILISDFLQHGRIPIVEHYGGHMLTDVIEGILYGLVNHDYTGAVVSPYSSMLTPFLAVLFFYFVKNAWNEDMALSVTLLFPFMKFWSYYGWGILVCLAAVSFVRKNSYRNALALWAALFFCAAYRLDLGFAFGCAAVISLMIYVLPARNMTALKNLFLTLAGCGIVCGAAWILICVLKSVNPVNRFIEFLVLSLSNQNWAFDSIGNSSKSVFSWCYVIIPFLVVTCLVCTVFSRNMRERTGDAKWMFLLVSGFAYLCNFPRGLVRHSLAEGFGFAIIWSSYIFLSMFFSCLKNNSKLLVPALMFFILCHTLLSQDSNFTNVPIADTALSRPASIIESWKPGRFDREESGESGQMTYWEKLKDEQNVVERVRLNADDQNTIDAYSLVLNALLDENETFADFMNRTSIYPIIGKENPAYVSQSPLQLSGEFAQRQFIDEIRGVPVILMPLDPDNYCRSSASDAIANAYRYYKVSEYIYQNYVPLCKYGDLYAVWCLKNRYQEFRTRIEGLVNGTDYSEHLADCSGLILNGAELTPNTDGTCTVMSTGTDPMICELQNLIDLSAYAGTDTLIRVRYTTDIPGKMQMFYTTEQNENYSAEKAVTVDINGTGTADFAIPTSAYTRLRLDTPENSTVMISSLAVKDACDYISYGYDGPFETIYVTQYVSYLHNYNHLEQLPRIWSEGDTKKAADNKVIANLAEQEGLFTFHADSIGPDENGNYLKIRVTYDGNDTDGFYEKDDELLPVTIIAGHYENGSFSERCRFGMYLAEGTHDYLIRISADYYWYLREINALQLRADGLVSDVNMQILAGD